MPFNRFQIKDYEHLCKTIVKSKYKTFTLQEYFEEKPLKGFIIMRHDVDYNINEALKIAEIEFSFGINSTYFIRLNNKTSSEKINQLNSKASEIGLHYDALTKAKSNMNKAVTIFADQLNFLNKIVDLKTVSAHGSSTKLAKNIELLDKIEMNDYNIIGDAMESVNFENLPYYTDAGRTWNLKKNKLNDFPDLLIRDYQYISKSTELCSMISSERYDSMYLSSHPELWAENLFSDIIKEVKYGLARFLVKKCIKYCKEKLSIYN